MSDTTVYVLDDDKITLSLIDKKSKIENVNCMLFKEQKSFLRTISKGANIIVIDYNLGKEGTNGLKLAEEILKFNKNCYIILLSSHQSIEIETDHNIDWYVDKSREDWVQRLFKYINKAKEKVEYKKEQRNYITNLLDEFINRPNKHVAIGY